MNCPSLASPYAINVNGYLTLVLFDARNDTVFFMCRSCGAHSDLTFRSQPLPETFRGVPHTPTCFAARVMEESLIASHREAA